MLTLSDPAIADAALPGKPEPYRRLDTAVLEALLLKGALGMSEDDISHLTGSTTRATTEQARERVDAGEAEAGVLHEPRRRSSRSATSPRPGENMPPKSTYFFPKVLTGMVFNPLEDDGPMNRSASRIRRDARDRAPARELHARRQGRASTRSPPTSREDQGGEDIGPEPAGAARRLARLLHGDHDGDVRQAQGLERRRPRGRLPLHARRARLPDPLRARHADARPPQRGAGRAPAGDRGQVPGAPHARGRGRLRRAGRARPERLARGARGRAARARGGAGDGRPRRPHRRRRARPAVRRRRRRAARRLHQAPRTTCAATPARSRSPAAAATTARRWSRPRCARRTRRSGCRRTRSRSSARSPPTPTFVTNYAIYPFVGLIEPGFEWVLAGGRGRRGARAAARRRCAPATASAGSCGAGCRSGPTTYEVGGHMIWGATARILGDLLALG